MVIYLSAPKTEKASEDGENKRLRYGLSSMQGWRASMEDPHAAYLDLDESTSFFGVYDGHGGKAVSKFCAKYLHQQVLNHEAYSAGDIGTSLHRSFLRGGDTEFKQNKFLPAEKQIVTADPDIESMAQCTICNKQGLHVKPTACILHTRTVKEDQYMLYQRKLVGEVDDR